jgi:hypothetical protein
MVHALEEIKRSLVPGGLLVDLRPVADQWQVELFSAQVCQEVGRLQDLPEGLADDVAAAEAVEYILQAGWFTQEKSTIFDLFYYWDTPEEMEAYIHEQWDSFIALPEDVQYLTRVVWANSKGSSLVRVRRKMHLSIYRKS